MLNDYRQRRLEPAALLEFDDHLAACPACRQAVREIMPGRAAVLKLRSSLHTESVPAQLERATKGSRLFRIAPVFAIAALLAIGIFAWLRGRPDSPEIIAHRPSISPPASKPAVAVALNDGGGQVTLDAEGNLRGLDAASPDDRRRIITALMTRKVELPQALQEVRASSSALMGSTPSRGFAVLAPIGSIVATTRPTFRWRPLGGATAYQVTITDPAAGYKEVAASLELRETEWTVDRPLPSGRTYSWQVTAQTPGQEVKAPAPAGPEARFRVLDREKAGELRRAQKTYAGHHLVLGVLYAEAGLLEEAEAEFQALVKANPDSDLARQLLHTVQTSRR
jgi:hypothetical protein